MLLSDRATDPALPSDLRDDLAMIRRNVELEARLIDDLLDVTRVSRGKIELHTELVEIDEILRTTIEICTGDEIVRRQLVVALENSAVQHHVLADRARLQQVLWNLINNAIKFSPDRARVVIRTWNPQPGRIAISVRDSGIGIDAEQLPRLFDAFEQGGRAITRRFGGLGLGLAISKALIELHGGVIRAESDGASHGSTFTIELDTCARSVASAPPDAATALTLEAPRRILLVEDHAPSLAILTRLLSRAGHDVSTANTVAAAQEILSRETFDLLISDLGLPDGSGIDIVRCLDGSSMPRIALSGYGMEGDVRACLDAGFDSHLTKPVDWPRLASIISQLTARSSAPDTNSESLRT